MNSDLDDTLALLSGADTEKAREQAYWNVFQSMKYIYGSCAFEDQNFDDFVAWLDSLFEPQGDKDESTR